VRFTATMESYCASIKCVGEDEYKSEIGGIRKQEVLLSMHVFPLPNCEPTD